MPIRVEELPETVEVGVVVDGLGDFVLTCRTPTFDEMRKEKVLGRSNAAWLYRSEFVVGWRGVEDQQEKEIPFSQEALSRLCRTKGVFEAINRALHLEVFGGDIAVSGDIPPAWRDVVNP